ncbi:MAG TPA: acetate/propionate family kinase [Streptosporangiaceae bacterium]|nr:acetate/propionate family kinase [Streptosporangiaceae bacterium]
MRILSVNAGSSTLKLSLLDEADNVVARRQVEAVGGRFDAGTVAEQLADLPAPPDAVGHRVVHGGREYIAPVRIDDEVERRLRALVELAPLHQPKSLAGIEAVRSALPGVPAVACFDTAFHATLPDAAATYAVPEAWRRAYGLRRYGFHGLSHAYATRRAAELTGTPLARLVVCHLGAGASLSAVRDGRCVDTTMGFTPLEGLVMATRSGDVDPGMLLWLAERTELTVAEISTALEHESGLLALAGTADMREVLAAVDRGEPRAVLALDVYVHRLRGGVAAMAAALGGLDALVFTGGVGEHAPEVRRRAAAGLAFLGVVIDLGANAEAAPDAEVTAPDASVRTFVIAAREDLEIAAGVRAVLS